MSKLSLSIYQLVLNDYPLKAYVLMDEPSKYLFNCADIYNCFFDSIDFSSSSIIDEAGFSVNGEEIDSDDVEYNTFRSMLDDLYSYTKECDYSNGDSDKSISFEKLDGVSCKSVEETSLITAEDNSQNDSSDVFPFLFIMQRIEVLNIDIIEFNSRLYHKYRIIAHAESSFSLLYDNLLSLQDCGVILEATQYFDIKNIISQNYTKFKVINYKLNKEKMELDLKIYDFVTMFKEVLKDKTIIKIAGVKYKYLSVQEFNDCASNFRPGVNLTLLKKQLSFLKIIHCNANRNDYTYYDEEHKTSSKVILFYV